MSLAACAIHTAYNKEKNKNVGEKSMRQTFAPNDKKSGQMKFFGAGQREPCSSIIGSGERLHKVLGQIDLGRLDSGERSLSFGLLVVITS